MRHCCSLAGLNVVSQIDFRKGFNLNNRKGQELATQIIIEQKPEVISMAPLCFPRSSWNYQKDKANGKRTDIDACGLLRCHLFTNSIMDAISMLRIPKILPLGTESSLLLGSSPPKWCCLACLGIPTCLCDRHVAPCFQVPPHKTYQPHAQFSARRARPHLLHVSKKIR